MSVISLWFIKDHVKKEFKQYFIVKRLFNLSFLKKNYCFSVVANTLNSWWESSLNIAFQKLHHFIFIEAMLLIVYGSISLKFKLLMAEYANKTIL